MVLAAPDIERCGARVQAGFVLPTRRQVFAKLQPFHMLTCPLVNLPEAERGRWGTDRTAEDMKKCVWVRPVIVVGVAPAEEDVATTKRGNRRST